MEPNGRLVLLSTFRVTHERKRENKKHEELPEGHHSPHGQMLQDKEGVWSPGSRTEEAGDDGAAEEGLSLRKVEPQEDTQGRRAPAWCTCGHNGVSETGLRIWELCAGQGQSSDHKIIIQNM